jgi:FtsP/CotA-like multicopper oxidase with cupredoxin domain
MLALLAFAVPAAAFTEPQVISSHNGVLRTTFTAEEGPGVIAGKRVNGTILINGQFPSPTLKVRPGDRIEIKFINKLHQDTNIHFHGLHVSPAGKSDNVFRTFRPGGTYQVSVKIPHDHPNGLYWYHPHLHGEVNNQVLRGYAGMISIEGGEEQVPSLQKFRKRNIALNLTQFDASGESVVNPNDENDPTSTTTVNGKLGQSISMRPGETQLWRIANISNEGFYKLSLDGHKMWVVGVDGNPTRVAQHTKTIFLVPGARYEVLVQAGKTGSYDFRQLSYFEGFTSVPAQKLATLNVAGKTTSSPPIPRHVKSFEDLSHAKVDVRRKWILSFSADNAPVFQAFINGKTFDPNRLDSRAKLGSVEEWTFYNSTTEDHPIHLHTNDFQLVGLNGRPVRPIAPIDDTVLPGHGNITIRFKPLTYTGLAVFHCHILFHEDSGMMATIRFVKSGGKASVVEAAGMPSVHDQAEVLSDVLDPGVTKQPRLPAQTVKDFWLFCKLHGLRSVAV